MLEDGWILCDIYHDGGSRAEKGPPGRTRLEAAAGRWSNPTWGRGGRARDRRTAVCPTWGCWPEGLGIQALGNRKGESPPLETLTHPTHRNEERPPTGPPATGGNTYVECGAGRAKLLHTRKPRTEVAPETTTPTRLWGCLAYDSQNPMQQLLSKALVATGPARPTTPSNPSGPLGSVYRFPNALPPVSSLRLRRGMGRDRAVCKVAPSALSAFVGLL